MKVDYFYETDFSLANSIKYTNWLNKVVSSENLVIDTINYIFCDDVFLLKINQDFLNHDTYTDIITFDSSEGKSLKGEIFISIERVQENALQYHVSFDNELKRVMVHGVLHLMGYKDNNAENSKIMRAKENEKINMFHVEQ